MNSNEKIYDGIFIAIALLLACSNDQESAQCGIERLSFTVNKSMLGPIYENYELGFSFSPPVSWERMAHDYELVGICYEVNI